MNDHVILDIPSRTIIKVVLVLVAAMFVYILRDVLIVLLFSVLIASSVSPFASRLERHRIPRVVGVLIFYMLFIGLAVVFLSLVIPVLSQELNELTHALPGIFERFTTQSGPERYLDLVTQFQNFLGASVEFLQVSSASFLTLLVQVFGGLVSFIAIIVISFYFAVMKQGVATFLASVIPEVYEGYAISLWKRMEFKVGKWFRGQVVLALAVGLAVFLGLSILHVRYALLLGMVAMAFEIVPFVGPVMSALPALGLAYLQSPLLALWVLFLYIGVQQLEGNVLTPLILGKSVGLHPVTVIVALLIGGKLAGILGVLLAVPVAVVIVEIFGDLARSRLSPARPPAYQ